MGSCYSTDGRSGLPAPLAQGSLGVKPREDAEDYFPAPLNFRYTGVPAFDAYFGAAAELLKEADAVNSDFMAAVIEVLQAAARTRAGALILEACVGRHSDIVMVDLLVNSTQTLRPHPEQVAALLAKPEVATADRQLSEAHSMLHGRLADVCKPRLHLSYDGNTGHLHNGPAWPVPEVAVFNAAITALRNAVGPGYCIKAEPMRAGAAYGYSSIVCCLLTPCLGPAAARAMSAAYAARSQVHSSSSPAVLPMTVPTLLEVARSPEVSKIARYQRLVRAQAQHIADITAQHMARGGLGWWDLYCRQGRVIVDVHCPEEQRVEELRLAEHAYNVQHFKLSQACCQGSSNGGPGSPIFYDAFSLVLRRLQQRVVDAGVTLDNVQLYCHFRDATDFELDAVISPAAGLPPFPECLPQDAYCVWKALCKCRAAAQVAADLAYSELPEHLAALAVERKRLFNDVPGMVLNVEDLQPKLLKSPSCERQRRASVNAVQRDVAANLAVLDNCMVSMSTGFGGAKLAKWVGNELQRGLEAAQGMARSSGMMVSNQPL